MLKTAELLELTDTDLLDLQGRETVIRVSPRNSNEEPEPLGEETSVRTVVNAGRIISIQYSPDTGACAVTLFSGSDKPDLLSWDCDEYRAEFTWNSPNSDEN